jgi:hypothetical protein
MLPGAISFIRMRQGQKPAPVSAEEALAYPFSALEEEFIAQRNARQAIGSPSHVRERLSALLGSTGADELMVQPSGATAPGRARTLELVASR